MSPSADGARLAVGAYQNDGAGDRAGHVRVFEWGNVVGMWIQLGNDVDGEAGDHFGSSASLSADGARLAVGAPCTGTNAGSQAGPWHAGHVRVFSWSNGAWVQLGDDIDGRAASDWLGHSVSLSADGTRLAVGAMGNDGTGTSAGHVRVFEWSNVAWIQLGGDVGGEAAGDRFGESISLSADGARLAVSACPDDGTGTDTGCVRVFVLSSGA